MKPTEAQVQHFIDSCLGLAASRWDRHLFRRAALAGYAAAEKKLMAEAPTDEAGEEFLARALSNVRAKLGA